MVPISLKLTFDRYTQKYGVVAINCNTYNGIFNDEDFMQELLKLDQKIYLSGTSAPWQSVVTEVSINIIANMARIIVIHIYLIWPEGTIIPERFTMEKDNSVWLYRHTPNRQNGLYPIEGCSHSIFEPVSEIFSNYHMWGCLTHVLEP